MGLRTGATPRGVWSPEANAQRQVAIDDSLSKAILSLPPTHVFRRDLLAYCTLRNLIPHPQLLPLHPDEEERQGAASSETAGINNVYDVSEVEQISIKHWQLDDGNCRAMCYALPLSKVRSVCLFNVGLNKEQLQLVCSTIPKTHVTALQLEWNSLHSTESNATEDHSPELRVQEDLQSGGNDSSEMFAQLLSESSALIFLSLRANGITSRGVVALAKALRTNKTLEALNLFQNSIDDAGARAFAYALPFNSTLKTLSLANNRISGRGAKLLVDGLTRYAAPPELISELEAAESQIHAQMEQAKKARKKIDRATAIAQLGLPVLETVDGVQYAPGNSTLEELLLSGNAQIGPKDVESLSEALELFQSKLQTHLRCIKLQRLPMLHQHKVQESHQHISEFITL
ncbi:hypothetical protein L917_15811 [Phytophthora nicotianae]|uniref:Uncharacterized protein n=1 Tax=Phytophthora nicotianae TaxID=4792 RepID=W2MMH2_PHYNI|nr:hypothetical protein L917_15811 [Phytophthora nicotianae]ETM37510.1 hypothetical protein L914_15944 [Phytophthora nicotianae]